MNGYLTVRQAAEKWEVTPRQIQLWCKTGKLEGAEKWNKDWMIPEKAPRPIMRHKHKLNKQDETPNCNGDE